MTRALYAHMNNKTIKKKMTFVIQVNILHLSLVLDVLV
jgi:hypothetical protein